MKSVKGTSQAIGTSCRLFMFSCVIPSHKVRNKSS